jgi:hypothetical protein
MSWLGFEPTIPVFERAKMIHALDRAATVIGISSLLPSYILHSTLLSETPNLCYSRSARDQFRTNIKNSILFILTFVYFDRE